MTSVPASLPAADGLLSNTAATVDSNAWHECGATGDQLQFLFHDLMAVFHGGYDPGPRFVFRCDSLSRRKVYKLVAGFFDK